MANAQEVYKQINNLTIKIIESGLCDDQNFPYLHKNKNGNDEIGIVGSNAIALKNIPYSEMYRNLLKERLYNIKMLDGALIGLQYRFNKNDLISHRLTFFPAPNIEEFQNEPDWYLNDELYVEIVNRNIVKTPLRFDYDNTDAFISVIHPKSHFTIGQYENCRIPVTAALTPSQFIRFIIRNFYRHEKNIFPEFKCDKDNLFNDSITEDERMIIHLCIPR